uniref:Uncharacterized protein n=1 Tax=Nelumbo nucifera TaxID=4432 RepID=A0A822XH06_NELNU|nr:TPA_asm: hypothetical protein HUJ06_020416 [Nelumbo nucifera]
MNPGLRLRQRIFRFSESTIDKIKSDANNSNLSSGSQSFSTFQSLDLRLPPPSNPFLLRFQVYRVEFGWGKPGTMRSGLNNKFDGMVYHPTMHEVNVRCPV